MKISLRFFREAADEIEHERGYYREKSPVAEAAFLRELDHAIEMVLELRIVGRRIYRARVVMSFPRFRSRSSTLSKATWLLSSRFLAIHDVLATGRNG